MYLVLGGSGRHGVVWLMDEWIRFLMWSWVFDGVDINVVVRLLEVVLEGAEEHAISPRPRFNNIGVQWDYTLMTT
jgi:hypothetical protein